MLMIATRRFLWLLVIASLPVRSNAAVIQRIFGTNASELSRLGPGGGGHIFLTGIDLGSAFAPPTVLLGAGGQCL